jgi:hypothetical protein
LGRVTAGARLLGRLGCGGRADEGEWGVRGGAQFSWAAAYLGEE